MGGPIRIPNLFRKSLAGIILAAAAVSGADKPNIIVVIFDDLGARELSCYGNAFNETPRIDKLAAEGIRFDRAYAPTPICSPSRATLLTGEAPARHGITDFLEDKDDNFLDPALHTTVAKTLKQAGYRTGLIGKWHLRGDYSENRGTPAQHGFDEAILTETSYIGGGDYRFPYAHIAGAKQKIFPDEDLTDRLGLEAVEFIERNKDQPFFLYLSHYAVHTKLDAPDSVVARFNAKRGTPGDHASPTRNPVLAAMAKGVDAGVGDILAKLREHNLDSNTLVIVTSDNGGEPAVTDNGELRLGKGNLYEGGIRVPFVARWPKGIQAGRVSQRPISHADLHPTFAALAGAALPSGQPMDGASLESLLRGIGEPAPRDLAWHFPQLQAAAGKQSSSALLDPDGKKVIRFYDTGRLEVYLPASDAGEATDLAPGNPNIALGLARKLTGIIARQQAGYVFRDGFADGDKSGWTDMVGAWAPSAGAYSAPAGEGSRSMTEDRYFGDLIYQAEVKPGTVGNAGIVFRANANAAGRFAFKGYFAYISATGEAVLSRSTGSAGIQIGRKAMAIEADRFHTVRIEARGPELRMFVDDTTKPLFAVRDTAYDGGLIGLRAHNGAAAFDDLYARALGDSTPVANALPSPRAARATGPMRVNGTRLWRPSPQAPWTDAAGRKANP